MQLWQNTANHPSFEKGINFLVKSQNSKILFWKTWILPVCWVVFNSTQVVEKMSKRQVRLRIYHFLPQKCSGVKNAPTIHPKLLGETFPYFLGGNKSQLQLSQLRCFFKIFSPNFPVGVPLVRSILWWAWGKKSPPMHQIGSASGDSVRFSATDTSFFLHLFHHEILNFFLPRHRRKSNIHWYYMNMFLMYTSTCSVLLKNNYISKTHCSKISQWIKTIQVYQFLRPTDFSKKTSFLPIL